jgi:hypothetical protein
MSKNSQRVVKTMTLTKKQIKIEKGRQRVSVRLAAPGGIKEGYHDSHFYVNYAMFQ